MTRRVGDNRLRCLPGRPATDADDRAEVPGRGGTRSALGPLSVPMTVVPLVYGGVTIRPGKETRMPRRSARPKLPPELALPLRRIRRDLAKIDAYLSDDIAEGHDPALTFDQAATVYREFDAPLREGVVGVTQLAAMARDAARSLARRRMPAEADTVSVPEVGTLARCMSGMGTTWDGLALVGALAARVADHAIDPDSGEIKPPAAIAEEAAMVVADAAGLGNASATFKSTSVESYGIDPDRYRTRHGGSPSVRFT